MFEERSRSLAFALNAVTPSVTLQSEKARRATRERMWTVARRRYQSGCLFKRGKRRKVWIARWREDVIRPDGSLGRTQRSVVIGLLSEIPTRRQAQIQLDQRLHMLNQGQQRPQATKHLQDFVDCEWTTLVLSTLKLSTQRGYRMVLGKHVMPRFGQRPICDITKLDIQHFVADKFRQGLAWQTVRNAWIVLSSVLDAAVDYSYLTSNPARGVKFPLQGLRKGPKILNAVAMGKLLAQLREPYRSMVVLTALTGLRVGELLALRWKMLDLAAGTIRISESMFQGQVQMPKSERSVRILPIGPQTRLLLEEHRIRAGAKWSEEALVFPNQLGGPLRESNLLERVLRPAAVAAGLGRVTWHQLRHVHASTLHDIGVPAKIAQEQLGHASIETTMKIYTHAIPDTHRRAIESLEEILFPVVPKCSQVAESRKAEEVVIH
jgi:integrase